MAQKVFDVNNPQEIFSLIDDKYIVLRKVSDVLAIAYDKKGFGRPLSMLKFNWRDKKEIIRPDNMLKYIGCVVWARDDDDFEYLGVLNAVNNDDEYKYIVDGGAYKYCRPAVKNELMFAEDVA